MKKLLIVFMFAYFLLVSCSSQVEKSVVNTLSSGIMGIENGNNSSKKEIQHSIVWKEINSDNYWSKIPHYSKLGISFSYPENWSFNCCGDRDDGSVHRIDALIEGRVVNPAEVPYILIMEYALNCRNEDIGYFENGNCAKTLSKNESFEYLTTLSGGVIQSNIGTGLVEVSRDWIMTRNMFNSHRDKGYVLRIDDSIYLIQFYNFPFLPEGFIREFFSKIRRDKL